MTNQHYTVLNYVSHHILQDLAKANVDKLTYITVTFLQIVVSQTMSPRNYFSTAPIYRSQIRNNTADLKLRSCDENYM